MNIRREIDNLLDIVENKLECIKEMLENEDYSREEIIREVERTIDSL